MRSLYASLALVCSSGIAFAESPEVYLTADPTTQTIVATIENAPSLPLTSFAMRGTRDHERVVAPAVRLRRFADGRQPVAIAIVISGQELWMGNDLVEPDPSAQYPGALRGFARALDQLHVDSAMPVGSTATVITYATGAKVRLPLGPIARLRGDALGTQRDYYQQIGTDLVAGVELAFHELARSEAPLKYIVVVGDGRDTDPDRAADELAALRKRAAMDNVGVFAIVYRTTSFAAPVVVTKLDANTKFVSSLDGIGAALSSFVDAVASRYYVTFDGTQLPWDGYEHELIVTIGRADMDPALAFLPRVAEPTPWWQSRWLVELGLGALFVLVIAGLLRLRLAFAERLSLRT
jgi:hypothetical protein